MKSRQLHHSSLLLSLVWLVSLLSCSSEEEPALPSDPPPNPSAELFTFLETFEMEANDRGFELPLDRFTMSFVDDLDGFCGYGWWDYDGTGLRRVEISQASGCWPRYNESQKEHLMFHEFGHALLSRPHQEVRFANGYPASLMCGVICNQTDVYYHPKMREYYLDELLAPNRTATPEWASLNELIGSVYEEDFESGELDWELFLTAGPSGNTIRWDTEITSDESNNNGLQVTTGQIPPAQSRAVLFKRFDLSDFPDCSGMQASVKVRFNQPMNGYVTMGLSLRETADDNAFMFHEKDTRITLTNDELELTHDIYCVPEKAGVVTISIALEAETLVDLSLDDIVVSLWD